MPGEIEKYELLKLINNGDCYSTKVDEQNAMRRDTISKAQLTHAQIEFNNLFGRSSFGQQSLKDGIKNALKNFWLSTRPMPSLISITEQYSGVLVMTKIV